MLTAWVLRDEFAMRVRQTPCSASSPQMGRVRPESTLAIRVRQDHQLLPRAQSEEFK
jgi:hypothetical protein